MAQKIDSDHVARLIPAVPAHQALSIQTNLSTGRKPDVRWRRTPGRPQKTWCSQIWIDGPEVLFQDLRRDEIRG